MEKDKDGTINLSQLSEAELKEHFRELDKIPVYPCTECGKLDKRACVQLYCDRFQKWVQYWYGKRKK